MTNNEIAILDSAIPEASEPVFQHLLNTYASEMNKVRSVWLQFSSEDMQFRAHDRSSTVEEIMKHQLLSERRFFGEFLGLPEPPASEVLPRKLTPQDYANRLVELAVPRLSFIADRDKTWWLGQVPFFDVVRERIWIFGGESCIPRTTAHSLRFIFDCWARQFLHHTGQPPMLPGKEQIQLVLSRLRAERATRKREVPFEDHTSQINADQNRPSDQSIHAIVSKSAANRQFRPYL